VRQRGLHVVGVRQPAAHGAFELNLLRGGVQTRGQRRLPADRRLRHIQHGAEGLAGKGTAVGHG
jgi:hypothetical protein